MVEPVKLSYENIDVSDADIAEAFEYFEGFTFGPIDAPPPENMGSLDDFLEHIARYGAAVAFAFFKKHTEFDMMFDEDEATGEDNISIFAMCLEFPDFYLSANFSNLLRRSLTEHKKARKSEIDMLNRVVCAVANDEDTSQC